MSVQSTNCIMSKLLLLSVLSLGLSCEKNSEKEIDVFFERLAVLVTKNNIISLNIQNANTTRTVEGGAYIPKEAINCKNGFCDIVPLSCKGIGCPPKDAKLKVTSILKYEPKHPDANKEGYVAYPDLDVQEEMAKIIRVQRAIDYLMDIPPVKKSYFYSKEVQKYFKKYPALNSSYNFEKLLRE